MPAKMFYRAGGVWREMKSGSAVRSGGAWRTLKAAWYRSGGVWRQVFQAFTFTAANESVSDVGVNDPPWTIGSAEAAIRYNADGTTTRLTFNAGNSAGTAWAASVPSTKYIRATLNSGSTPWGEALNTWHALSSARTWGVSSGAGTVSCSLNVQFSNDGSTADHSVTVTLSATVV